LQSSRSALGDQRYRILTGDTFSPDMILATVDLVDEHAALKCANDLEAAIHIWRRKTGKKAGDQVRKPTWTVAATPSASVLMARAEDRSMRFYF
jgi:hypothetical protein